MAQVVRGLLCLLFFALVCELKAGVLGPFSQCFGAPEHRQLEPTYAVTRRALGLRGGDTSNSLSETLPQNVTLGQDGKDDKRGNIINLLKSLLSGKLGQEQSEQAEETAQTAKTVESPKGKTKREDDGWLEISASEVVNSEVMNSEVANNVEQDAALPATVAPVETAPEAGEELADDKAEAAAEEVDQAADSMVAGDIPVIRAEELGLEQNSEMPNLDSAPEIDSEMFESAMAETAPAASKDVQIELSEMKNKVSSLRRTQSELELKLARYNGDDPATVQQEELALPDQLNLKVMKGVLDELLMKQEVLSSRVEELAIEAQHTIPA